MKNQQYLYLITAVSAVYLTAELSFNIRLVDSAMVTDLNEIKNLELWGRSIAATGCAIAILRFIPLQRIRSRTAACAIILAATWFITFFGQKILIDGYVDSSTQEQRINAWHVVLLKQGLNSNALQLQGLQTTTGNTGRDKTLISILGLVSYSLPEYIQLLRNRSKDISISIADHQATESIEPLFEKFLQLRSIVKTQYQEGLRAQELAKSYPLVLQRELEQFFNERRHCEKEAKPHIQACIDTVEEIYNKNMRALSGHEISWKEFCQPSKASTTYRMRAGSMVTMITDNLDCRNIETTKIEKVMLHALGIKYLFESWTEFSRFPEIQAALRKLTGQDGFVDPDMDKEQFLKLVVKPEFRKKALAQREQWLTANISDDDGRRAIRSVIVHPVALCFSLFFGMINAVGLFVSVSTIFRGATFGHSLNAGILTLALVTPSVLGGSEASIAELVKLAPGELGTPLHWVMTVEPWLYNILGGDL